MQLKEGRRKKEEGRGKKEEMYQYKISILEVSIGVKIANSLSPKIQHIPSI
ncbi:MAG: hypothetical protein F6K54_04160 [Okeania sp. SIO3B5]|uniref:hypothetical protein n=1 Tax=Okeania sp. SIO3B5 TaxID=2607811 RepID=UPI0013FFBA53|nr:hypothetical protein [Okeania sp. SIO3B5]NEO52341.1 hypothetical protein [Okeania sp. SIO3B5]